MMLARRMKVSRKHGATRVPQEPTAPQPIEPLPGWSGNSSLGFKRYLGDYIVLKVLPTLGGRYGLKVNEYWIMSGNRNTVTDARFGMRKLERLIRRQIKKVLNELESTK